MNRLRPILIALLFIALPMVMLWHLWSEPLSAGEDDMVYYYPLRVMTAEHLKAGELPLYNPLEATGMPLMADPQTAVMHPTTWLFVVLPPRLAYSLSLFVAFSLAGGGAYLYMRRIGLVRAAAIFGAVALMFCGFFVGHRVHLSLILTAAMLPWGLWAMEGLRRNEKRRAKSEERKDEEQLSSRPSPLAPRPSRLSAAAWLAPVLFLSIAAGHWPTLVHLGIVWLFYALLRLRPFWSGAALGAVAAAIAVAIAWPQIHITSQLMAEVTRNKIGYATAGENSFFPTSAILGLLPFFQGTRNPNLFYQTWWGSWHLCEMLGYVGLVTLALAGGAVWKLYRKDKEGTRHLALGTREEQEPLPRLVPLVRVWTWLIVGAGVFMLGYYLPTYKLVYMLPVLGVVRCPARMVLAVDMGLAVLAAVAIHCVLTAPADERVLRMKRAIRLLAVIVLPLTMLVMVRFWAILGTTLQKDYPDKFPFLPFDGGANAAIRAAHFTNPAVFIPAMLMAVTAYVLAMWLRRSDREIFDLASAISPPPSAFAPRSSPLALRSSPFGAILILLLLADLFWITGFVDVPSRPGPSTELSPAAKWLKEHDPDTSSYRVWGLSRNYHHRPDELLLPKTCEVMGIQTIGNYGPFQSPRHVELFGFRPWGECKDWEGLLQRNHLLSLYGVKYILVAKEQKYSPYACFSSFLRDFYTPGEEFSEDTDNPPYIPSYHGTHVWNWETNQSGGANRFGASAKVRGSGENSVLVLQTPQMFAPAQAWIKQKKDSDGVGNPAISFEARGPEGGAGNYLEVRLVEGGTDQSYAVQAEQIGTQWRHFRKAFLGPGYGRYRSLVISTLSERPIEIRNVIVDEPWNEELQVNVVYKCLKELPAIHPKDPPVVIYQNMNWRPIGKKVASTRPASRPAIGPGQLPGDLDELEYLKWPAAGTKLDDLAPADISIRPVDSPARLFWYVTLPVSVLYLAAVGLWVARRRKAPRVSAGKPPP